MNKHSIRMVQARVYEDGSEMLGLANVDLPELKNMTDTFKGFGVAGEVDMLTIGHYESMEVTFNFTALANESIKLSRQKPHNLEVREAQQAFSASGEKIDIDGVFVYMKTLPKSFSLGKVEVSASTDTSITQEVIYIKITRNGRTVFELDKFNMKNVIDGDDVLAAVNRVLNG